MTIRPLGQSGYQLKTEKSEIIAALDAGALAVSVSDEKLWNL